MSLQIEHRDREDYTVITLTGRLMLGPESHEVETLVSDLIAAGRRQFIFELSGISHIDSTGIGRFISCFNKVMQARGRLLMASAPPVVRDGFRVTRLDTVFKFFPDLEAAAQSLR